MWPEIPLPYATDVYSPPASDLGRKSELLPAEERPIWLPGRGEEVPPHTAAWRRGPIKVSRAGWDKMRRVARLLRVCWSPLGVERRDSWTGGHCCWVGRGPGPLQRSPWQRLRLHYLKTPSFPSGVLFPAAWLHLPLVFFVTVLSLFVRPMPSCNNGYHLLSIGCASCQQAFVSAGFFAAGSALIYLGGMERLQSPPLDCGRGRVGARKTD